RECEGAAVATIDVDAGSAAAVGKNARRESVVWGAKPGLGEVGAGVVGRHVVARECAARTDGRSAKYPAPVERFREQVADDALDVEPSRAAAEIVAAESALDLREVDGVETRDRKST